MTSPIRTALLAAALLGAGAGMALAQGSLSDPSGAPSGSMGRPSTGATHASPKGPPAGTVDETRGTTGMGTRTRTAPRTSGGNAAPGQPGSTPESKPPAGD